MTSTHKEESEVKLDIKSNEEEEENDEEEEEQDDEQEQEEEIIDLDFEANTKQEEVIEEKKEENQPEEVPNVVDNFTEPNINQQNLGVTTETKNNKTAKKTFFTPKNTTMLGKIFINTTNVNTEENANFTKTDGNNSNKTAITLVSKINNYLDF